MGKSQLEESMAFQIRAAGLSAPTREFSFLPGRKYRADFAWPGAMLLLEVEGGGFVGGRHNTGVGLRADCEKYNLAMLAGWRVLRVTDRHISNGQALAWLEEAMRLPFE